MKTFLTNDGRKMVEFPYNRSRCYPVGNIQSASGLPLSNCCQAPVEYTGGGLAINDGGHSYGMNWRAEQCIQCGELTNKQKLTSGIEPSERTR